MCPSSEAHLLAHPLLMSSQGLSHEGYLLSVNKLEETLNKAERGKPKRERKRVEE